MRILKRIFVLLFALIQTTCLAKSEKYIVVDFMSSGMFEQSESSTRIMAGDVKTLNSRSNKTEIKIYDSKDECVNAIKSRLTEVQSWGDNFIYDGNGVYKYTGNYGRIVCLNYYEVKHYIDDDMRNFALLVFDRKTKRLSESAFTVAFPNKIPYEVIESEIKHYTVFPLDSDQKAARKLTEQMDKELSKINIKSGI